MNIDDLAMRLEDRDVRTTLISVLNAIELLPPNGARVHRRSNMIGIIEGGGANVLREYGDCSFKHLKARNPSDYKRLLEYLDKAIEEGIQI